MLKGGPIVARAAECRIGTSGFHYDHWKGIFYPEGLAKKDWFSFYAEHFDTLEVNNTFYRVPDRKTFEAWRDQTPRKFAYTLKFSRFASHDKRLLSPDRTISYFLERASPLLSRTAAILVQLPPRWRVDIARLDDFLAHAPRRHRWAVEVRDQSWLTDEVYETLARHNAALCIHDMLPDHPRLLTAPWTYVRFHGAGGGSKYAGSYTDGQLREWAGVIERAVNKGRDVLVYFNNDQHGHALRNALRLRELLDMPAPQPDLHRHSAAEPARR